MDIVHVTGMYMYTLSILSAIWNGLGLHCEKEHLKDF